MARRLLPDPPLFTVTEKPKYRFRFLDGDARQTLQGPFGEGGHAPTMRSCGGQVHIAYRCWRLVMNSVESSDRFVIVCDMRVMQHNLSTRFHCAVYAVFVTSLVFFVVLLT